MLSTGVTSSATISSGGQVIVSSGGDAISAQVSGGTSGFFNLVISSGGSSLDAFLTSGGREEVFSGGTTISTTISAPSFATTRG